MPIDKKSLARELNPDGRPLRLTEAFRKRLEGNQRMKLQPPEGRVRGEFDRRISGLPGDVLLALESMRALAEQGNKLAAKVYEYETKRLGLWYDKKQFWLPKGNRVQ
jgi:hypothetical protein